MERMGQSTNRTALIYLHTSSARQHHLANAVTGWARTELGTTDEPPEAGVARMWPDPQSVNGDAQWPTGIQDSDEDH